MATIDAGLMVRLLAPGDAEGASNAVKGQALEKAIRYAFEQIPGVTCYMQDERNAFETEEVDLLFANVAHEDGLARFDTEILVEAKNWSSKVGAMEISWFATKLRRRSRSTGVLVAAQGITGDRGQLTAARMQVILALNEGQEILVLTREELEAVPSGERLAQLLQRKRAHLVGRQGIYEAEPEELRHRASGFRRGREAFRTLMRSERLRRIEEAQGQLAKLPDGDAARAAAVRAALEAVEPLIAARRKDPDLDPRWTDVREALMAVAGLCVGWLAGLGYEHADTILSNVAMTGADRLPTRVGSRLWDVLSGYYVEELGRESPELPRDSLLFGLAGMLVEEIWNLDEYWPEPEPDDE